MCKICKGNYNINMTGLDCRYCNKIKEIPILPNLQELECSETEIKEIPILPNLQYLSCSNTEIKEIPILPNLLKLYCYCTEIKEIPILPNLQFLSCPNTEIKEIPILPNLQYLTCDFGYFNNKEEIKKYYAERIIKTKILKLYKIKQINEFINNKNI